MLGKLFKYEFKNTSKIMLTIYGVLLAVSILGAITLSTDAVYYGYTEWSGISSILTVAIMFAYILSVFALFIVTYVYICVHFYKTMYSDQGYLTHTLPVSPMATLNVKLIVSFVWVLGSMLLLVGSILLLITGATRGEIWHNTLSSIDIAMLNAEFESIGMTFGSLIGYFIATIILSCLAYPLMVFTCASVGQLFNQYKIVAAIVTGIVIYFAQQIASMILAFSMVPIFEKQIAQSLAGSGTVMFSFSPLFNAALLFSIVLCVIYYITCSFIVRKRINLS